jgi:branched-chain amino acid aminotransferase
MLAVSAQQTTIHVAIATWPWPSYFGADRMAGIRLGMGAWKRPSPETAPTQAKATGLYMIGTMSKHKAEEEGYNDALLLDWRGLVSEATGANIFLVIDGDLHTPTPDCFLDGITRRSVMALARRKQMKVIERPIEASELTRATEVFLAGTAAEVCAVREIAGHNYTPGRITETLMRDYDALVQRSPDEVARLVA